MTFLMTTILISAIISWLITHKYQQQIVELNEELDRTIKDYDKEIHKLMCEHLEQTQLMQEELKRRYRG